LPRYKQLALHLEEKLDPQEVLTEVAQDLFDYRISAGRLADYHLEAPKLEPFPLPAYPPVKPQLPDTGFLLEMLSPPAAQAAQNGVHQDCAKSLDQTVANMRRLKVTLGHDNKLGDAVKNFLLTAAKDTGVVKINVNDKDILGDIIDNTMWSYDLAGEITDGKSEEAKQRVVKKFATLGLQENGLQTDGAPGGPARSQSLRQDSALGLGKGPKKNQGPQKEALPAGQTQAGHGFQVERSRVYEMDIRGGRGP
jgi:hypothetical protein